MPKTSKLIAALVITGATLGVAAPVALDLTHGPSASIEATGLLGDGRMSGGPAAIGYLGDGLDGLSGADGVETGYLGDGRTSGTPIDTGYLGDG